MSTLPPQSTAENRAILIQSYNESHNDVMTQALAGGLLQYSAMPAGPGKVNVDRVAHVIANSYEGMSPPIALGMAFLLKISDSRKFARIARRAAADGQ